MKPHFKQTASARTALHVLFETSDRCRCPALLLLLAWGLLVSKKDKIGRTALHIACRNGAHVQDTTELLQNGKAEVDIDSRDFNGQTSLSMAAENGHRAVVKFLLETGKADAGLKDRWGQTPLTLTTRHGHDAVVKLLLETGKADVES